MNILKYPNQSEWPSLMARPVFEANKLTETTQNIIERVRTKGDEALIQFAKQFDKASLKSLTISSEDIQKAILEVPKSLQIAIKIAKSNIERFHEAQQTKVTLIETMPGVQCWRKSVAIDKVGLYIPGGTAPLFSTILMLGIPAQLAGCKEIVLCTPPDRDGEINPAILYTAQLVGITKIYKVGGAQAVAAMAYGTASIPSVNKIFGPGNQYVTKAKELVQQSGIAIDMPAGPSEVLVIADANANPDFVAADLLSQAEHGADSQVILLADNESILNQSIQAIEKQLNELPRKVIAQKALTNSRFILLEDLDACVKFSNAYAPEHLILNIENAKNIATQITNAGSVFLGAYSCESAGDYASGTNHTLPTNGYAKNYSGVSLDSFVKKITFQRISATGISNLGPAIEIMATAEGLEAHKNAVSVRLKSLANV